ncbi:nucleotidyltransferase family protein [Cognatiyoonia sp. IB215446]|uniref:nucleotidyltransferase family protein n=1 Tax=Cognatiyoonia sp. IB215446 TaxID=3097355 RepID=UPI002A168375|nr:nucleotidyltransferase family protein [Cognatiyoonia sp. IB215446]MDX8350545.1 nucleotidyltransferase family protein [Cognatiyoonia sp. IB215446]
MTTPIMLFAAGLGTRMGDLVRDKPKPLIKVAGKALIDHALDLTMIPEVGQRVVNVHYKAEMLRAHLAPHPVLISDETAALLETGGGLKKALPLLGAGPVLTMNTDAVWQGPNPIDTILNAWRPEMEALLLLVRQPQVYGHRGAGDFRINADGRLVRAPEAVYSGLQMLRIEGLEAIRDKAFSMNVLWDQIAERGGLYGVHYAGHWCDVGQPSSIPLAESMPHV